MHIGGTYVAKLCRNRLPRSLQKGEKKGGSRRYCAPLKINCDIIYYIAMHAWSFGQGFVWYHGVEIAMSTLQIAHSRLLVGRGGDGLITPTTSKPLPEYVSYLEVRTWKRMSSWSPDISFPWKMEGFNTKLLFPATTVHTAHRVDARRRSTAYREVRGEAHGFGREQGANDAYNNYSQKNLRERWFCDPAFVAKFSELFDDFFYAHDADASNDGDGPLLMLVTLTFHSVVPSRGNQALQAVWQVELFRAPELPRARRVQMGESFTIFDRGN